MDWQAKLDSFKKDDRVRLSREAVRCGLQRSSKQQDRIGTVINVSTCVRVKWDGNRSAGDAYHPDYLQHIDPQ